MPTRGNVPKTGTRAEASPVSRPCQKGEFAASASSSGTCTRSPRSARTADSGVGHGDVHVQRERRLAPRELAHRVVDRLVARAGRDLDVAPLRERVRARSRRRAARAAQVGGQPRAQVGQLADRGRDGRVRARDQLERRAVRLGRGVVGDLRRQRRQHLVDPRGERPVVRVEEHHLLLDADGPRRRGGRRVPLRPARQAGHGSTQVSFAPPFCEELTTSAPSSSATRVIPPGQHRDVVGRRHQHVGSQVDVARRTASRRSRSDASRARPGAGR